jgi:hypothetical protein
VFSINRDSGSERAAFSSKSQKWAGLLGDEKCETTAGRLMLLQSQKKACVAMTLSTRRIFDDSLAIFPHVHMVASFHHSLLARAYIAVPPCDHPYSPQSSPQSVPLVQKRTIAFDPTNHLIAASDDVNARRPEAGGYRA